MDRNQVLPRVGPKPKPSKHLTPSQIKPLSVGSAALGVLLASCGQSGGSSSTLTSGNLLSSPSNAICSTFSGSSTGGNSTNGILSKITYLDYTSASCSSYNLSAVTTASFAVGQSCVVQETGTNGSAVNLIFNQVYTPSQNFNNGFQTSSGTYLKDASGNTLYQYFSLHMDTQLTLTSSDPSGSYQLAVLSDDGSVVTLTGTTPSTTLISNDGTHSNLLQCASTGVTLNQGTLVPIHMDYFQGPGSGLGLVMLWRKITTIDTTWANSGCDSAAQGANYYFDTSLNPTNDFKWLLGTSTAADHTSPTSIPTPWKVIPATNFKMPVGYTNPCN